MPMQPEDNKGISWLGRLLPRRAQGDVVAADIGANARGVVVGKNIVQIGVLSIPLLPLVLAVIGLVAAAGGIYWWRSRGPLTMGGSFNVAVADFADDGGIGDRGHKLSTWVGRALEQQSGESDPNLLVWYDELPRSRKGARIDTIPGNTPEQRRAKAAERALALKANVLIYGTIDRDNRLLLEYYVAPDPTLETDLNKGSFQLGSTPIMIDMTHADAIEGELTKRTGGLFELVRGLQLSRSGDMQGAYETLKRANSKPTIEQNREMLLFLQAQAASFIAQNTGDDDKRKQIIADAFATYDQIIDLDQSFIRAYIGRASLNKTLAKYISEPQQRIDSGYIQKAIDDLMRAQAIATDPTFAKGIVPAALGTTYNLEGQTYQLLAYNSARQGHTSDAKTAYAKAEQAFIAANANLTGALDTLKEDPQHSRLLGQAYLALGNSASQHADVRNALRDAVGRSEWYTKAIVYYDACIAQANNPTIPDALLTDQIIPLCKQYRQVAAQKVGKS